MKYPASDFLPRVTEPCHKTWQEKWTAETNNTFRNQTCHWPHDRRDSTIITRLRIGHTRLTHKYLLSGDSRPMCDKYNCPLTVQYILLES